jgi:hypothetical protein
MTDRKSHQDFVSLPPTAIQALLAATCGGREPIDAANELRHLGLECGGALHDHLRSWTGGAASGDGDPADLASDTFWAGLTHFFEELGWGRLEQEQLHPGILSLSSADWFEAAGRREHHPCCHYSIGVLAELLRRVADSHLAVMEVDCRGAGGDRCNFLVGSPSALDAVFSEVSDGANFRQAIAVLG